MSFGITYICPRAQSISFWEEPDDERRGEQREDEDVIKLAELLADQTTSNENMVWCSRSIGVLANYKVNHPILPGWPSRREEEVSDSCDSKAHN